MSLQPAGDIVTLSAILTHAPFDDDQSKDNCSHSTCTDESCLSSIVLHSGCASSDHDHEKESFISAAEAPVFSEITSMCEDHVTAVHSMNSIQSLKGIVSVVEDWLSLND